MPSKNVMHKFGQGKLHSGSKKGPVVKKSSQAVAIMLSERRGEGKSSSAYKKHESFDY